MNISDVMDGYEARLAAMIDDLAAQVVIGARRRVYRNLKTPRANSPLAESIRTENDPAGGVKVFTDKPYARYVEFGTINQPPRPFLTPAIQDVKVTFSTQIMSE